MAAVAGMTAALALHAGAAQATDEAFRIGMVAAQDGAPVVDGLSAIRTAFADAVGMPVEVIAARDYSALIEAHIGGRVDYAIYSTQAYAVASLRCDCLEPVVLPLGERGTVGVRSVLIARRGTALQTVALGPADSLTGRLAPMATWPRASEMEQQGRFTPAASLGEAEAMFLEGAVDGFFGWVPAWTDTAAPMVGGTLARLRAAGLGAGDYEVVWSSDILRHGPHAVQADVAPETLRRLRQMLVSLGPDREELRASLDSHYGGGFSAASREDYDAAIEAMGVLHQGRARP